MISIIILSNLEIKFLITLILVEILDPPIIQVIGLVISEIVLLSALTSKSSCNPENEGKNFGILLIEAWGLCEQEKASFTYISPRFDKSSANLLSFCSSSE